MPNNSMCILLHSVAAGEKTRTDSTSPGQIRRNKATLCQYVSTEGAR